MYRQKFYAYKNICCLVPKWESGYGAINEIPIRTAFRRNSYRSAGTCGRRNFEIALGLRTEACKIMATRDGEGDTVAFRSQDEHADPSEPIPVAQPVNQ